MVKDFSNLNLEMSLFYGDFDPFSPQKFPNPNALLYIACRSLWRGIWFLVENLGREKGKNRKKRLKRFGKNSQKIYRKRNRNIVYTTVYFEYSQIGTKEFLACSLFAGVCRSSVIGRSRCSSARVVSVTLLQRR